MSRNRILLVGIVALILSGIVTFWAYRMLRGSSGEPAHIVVARKKLSLGSRLTAQDVTTAPWPESLPLEGSIGDVRQVENRAVVVDILPNEPVLESKLAPKEGGVGLTAVIEKDKRAVAVKVNDVIGVAGFVLPGTYVDVILVGQPRQNEEPASKVIVENVKVLTAGKTLEMDPNGKPQDVQVVTLLVTPEEAQKVALAMAEGRMQLALRNPLDTLRPDPPAIPRPELFYGVRSPIQNPERPAASSEAGASRSVSRRSNPAPPPPRVFEVELIQGDKMTKHAVR